MIRTIVKSDDPYGDIEKILSDLHEKGPDSGSTLERISLYKRFYPEVFTHHEEKIISALGLFYKIKEPSTLYSFLMKGFGEQYKKDFGEEFTPVQASVRRALESKKYISISAPTSAGKSYAIREFIAQADGDAVIVVPSRALIAEYLSAIRRRFGNDKGVMISPFVDNVFTNRELRRIFVLTPERARDLFLSSSFDFKIFFFDEAQVSEEKNRGVIFDVLVRRIEKHFNKAKLIFAHPFVSNPQAQILKHNFVVENAYARAYAHGSVGKVCVFQHQSNKNDYYFSPYDPQGHLVEKCVKVDGVFSDFAFNGDNSVLIYVSKASIYNGKFLDKYQEYIDAFSEVVDTDALNIVSNIERLVGADQTERYSDMVYLLKKGVVVHHGSVPLEVRFLIEEYIREGYAKICFATSTLAQGINMPFDIVWLDNMRFLGGNDGEKSLALKNLIGRSGRLTKELKFDYGYIYTKNPIAFRDKLNYEYRLKESSLLDNSDEESDPDLLELIESIKSNQFNDAEHMPESKIDRFRKKEVIDCNVRIFEILYSEGKSIRENISGGHNRDKRVELYDSFKKIFQASINRVLKEGEEAVFKNAIGIFLLVVQGYSFREIVGIRYNKISNRSGGGVGSAKFSQRANKLPDITIEKPFPLFYNDVSAKSVSYDVVVFDTYDYLDQVISFSLSDVFCASFNVCKSLTGDGRADKVVELIRFGTNNVIHILLMRYGFPPESLGELSEYVQFVNEKTIIFNSKIENAPKYIRDLTIWYRE